MGALVPGASQLQTGMTTVAVQADEDYRGRISSCNVCRLGIQELGFTTRAVPLPQKCQAVPFSTAGSSLLLRHAAAVTARRLNDVAAAVFAAGGRPPPLLPLILLLRICR